MKIDKHLKGLSDRINALSGSSSSSSSSSSNNNDNDEITSNRDDVCYLATGSEPPRFAYYRQVRIERSNDEWKKETF